MTRLNGRPKGPSARAELERLSGLIDERDGYTAAHSRRVVAIAAELGEQLGMSAKESLVVRQAARFHDVGKLTIPDWILLKPGPLTRSEWRVMRSHSVKGAKIVADLGFSEETVAAVRHHHERFDGTGYPDGLAGEAIPLAARVIHVADTIDSITTDRVYQQARGVEEAVREVMAASGAQFCPTCVSALDRSLSAVVAGVRPLAPTSG